MTVLFGHDFFSIYDFFFFCAGQPALVALPSADTLQMCLAGQGSCSWHSCLSRMSQILSVIWERLWWVVAGVEEGGEDRWITGRGGKRLKDVDEKRKWGRMEEWKGAKGWIREKMYLEREERRGNGKRVRQKPLQNSIWILLSAIGKNLKRKFFFF